MFLVEELTEVFGCDFGSSVDVFGDRNDGLVNPGCGGTWGGREGDTEGGGGGEIGEGSEVVGNGRFEEVKGAGNVG